MLKFEDYLADFTNSISLSDFLINLLVATVLCLILKVYYVRFGMSVANREKFAANFVPLSLATMLVITVVQSSIALSLGLVGALSIVRFRAAIKEPEELTYLFLAIGIGLVTGANKPVLAIISVVLILILLLVNRSIGGKKFNAHKKMYLNIRTALTDVEEVIQHVKKELNYVELKRMDTLKQGLFISLIVKSESVAEINQLQKTLKGIDETIEVSLIDQPELVL